MTVSHTRTFVASVLSVLRERQSGGLLQTYYSSFLLVTMFLFPFFFVCFLLLLLHNETFGPFILGSASRQFVQTKYFKTIIIIIGWRQRAAKKDALLHCLRESSSSSSSSSYRRSSPVLFCPNESRRGDQCRRRRVNGCI